MATLHSNSPPDLASFYSGRHVLITGSTGFLGKVLIEKLLRCFPDIGTVYLLIRPSKKQPNVHERMMREIVESGVFERLESRRPDYKRHLRAVAGDVGQPGLGLSAKDTAEIQQNVSVVLHGAATVKFHEHMHVALNINVEGVRRIIELCSGMKQLAALLHVSTAYVNATRHGRQEVQESIDPLDFDHRALQRRIMETSAAEVEEMTPQILRQHGEWPNTYTLTKRVGEVVLLEEGRHLPYIVVRPSIVTCSEKDPYPGWVDTLIGPGGLVLATALGMLHVMPGNPRNIVDLVPVDYVINCIVSCAWYAATHTLPHGAPRPVVHIGSSSKNPTQWGLLLRVMQPYFVRHPSPKQVARIHFRWVQNPTTYSLMHYLFHLAPAALADAVGWVRGTESNNVSKISRLTAIVDTLLFFTTNEWVFSCAGVERVMGAMAPADRQDFSFDASNIIWDAYFETFAHGLKRYILREETEFARARL